MLTSISIGSLIHSYNVAVDIKAQWPIIFGDQRSNSLSESRTSPGFNELLPGRGATFPENCIQICSEPADRQTDRQT